MAHLVHLVLVLVVADSICRHTLLSSLVGVGLLTAAIRYSGRLGAFNGVDVVVATAAGR